MKRASLVPLSAIVSMGLLSMGGCMPEGNRYDHGSHGYSNPSYSFCVCDADCPSGQFCDQWSGYCEVGGSASGGHGGKGGAGGVDGGQAGGHAGTRGGLGGAAGKGTGGMGGSGVGGSGGPGSGGSGGP